MDERTINQAMNEGAQRLSQHIRTSEPGSWVRLIDYATTRSWEGAELVSLLTVANQIGYADGESSANADFHEDNPAAVQRAREILRMTD
jgi:hypothetical protein